MTAKEWLKPLPHLNLAIQAKQESYDILFTRCTKVNKQLQGDRVQTSRDIARQEEDMARMAQISAEIDDMKRMQDEARELINSLDDNLHVALLTHRYINGRSWHYVAEAIGYAIRQTFRTHGDALRALEKKMAVNGIDFAKRS